MQIRRTFSMQFVAKSSLLALSLALFGARCASAQTFVPVTASLPDAPDAPSAEYPAGGAHDAGSATPSPAIADTYDKYILPGQQAPPLHARDKFILGVRDAVSPLSAIGWVASAGYEQAANGSPNYGQTGTGFAQRLGASAARAGSEGIFGDSILAPLLHEDPRYYQLGRGHSFVRRLVYSGTRGLITRTDGGRATVNLANLGGNLGGAALTNLYYPSQNTSFSETAKTFGSSVGGSALGFVVSEFLSDTLQFLHLKDQ